MSEVITSIEDIEKMGYRLSSCKDFSYKSELNVKEKEFADKFTKSAMKNSAFMRWTLAIVSVGICIVAAIAPVDFDPPVMRIFVPAFISSVSVLGIIMIIVRAKGAKKVAYAAVIAKQYRRSSNRGTSNIIYSVIAYQQTPEKLYAKNIYVNKETYEAVHSGDIVIIIKNNLDNQAYLWK